MNSDLGLEKANDNKYIPIDEKLPKYLESIHQGKLIGFVDATYANDF